MAQETGTVRAGPSQVVTITVGPNNTITVDKDRITLRKEPKDEASWQREGGTGEFSITFQDRSPFPQKTYDHTTAKHLTPHSEAQLGRHKYTVHVLGCNDLDPEVIVDP